MGSAERTSNLGWRENIAGIGREDRAAGRYIGARNIGAAETTDATVVRAPRAPGISARRGAIADVWRFGSPGIGDRVYLINGDSRLGLPVEQRSVY
jgi:hypothetical protein